MLIQLKSVCRCSPLKHFIFIFSCSSVWRLHMLLVAPSVILVNLFDFYFASRVHFIEKCSILIQRKLISLWGCDDGEESLVQLKEASSELWRLSEMLNERFAYTMLVTVAGKLAVLVIDIYWVYIRMVHSVLTHFIRE